MDEGHKYFVENYMKVVGPDGEAKAMHLKDYALKIMEQMESCGNNVVILKPRTSQTLHIERAVANTLKHIPVSLVGPPHTSYIDEMALIPAREPVPLIHKEIHVAGKKIGIARLLNSIVLANMSSVSIQDVEDFTFAQRGNISPTQIELNAIPNFEYETPYMPEYRAPGSFKKLNQRQKRKRSKW